MEVLRALRIANWEAVFSTIHVTLTAGAFQTGFALALGASNFWIGVIGSIPTFAALVQLASSVLVERLGKRKGLTAYFTIASRMLWVPILLLPFAVPAPARLPAFLALFILASILAQVPVPAFTSWLSDLVPPDHRGRYFARRNMLAGLTVMVVSMPCAWFLDLATKRHLFADRVGFAVLFAMAAVAAAFAFIAVMRQPEPPMQVTAEGQAGGLAASIALYRRAIADRQFRGVLAFSAVFAVAQFLAAPFYMVFAIKELHLDYMWLQAFAAIASLAGLLSMPVWGYLSDKFGNRALLGISIVGVALTPLPWVLCSPSTPTLNLVLLVVNHIAGGLFWSGVGLTQFNILIASTPTESRSIYIGAMSAVTGLLGGLAPILGGVVVTAFGTDGLYGVGGYRAAFILNSLVRFGALACLRLIRLPDESSTREVLTQLGGVRVGTLVQMRRLQQGASADERTSAAHALRAAGTTLPAADLLQALFDPSRRVRAQAARTLGDMGGDGAVEALARLIDEPGLGVAEEAAEALGRLGEPAGAAALLRGCRSDRPSLRMASLRALADLQAPEAQDEMTACLDEGDPAVRAVALRGLRRERLVGMRSKLLEVLAGAGAEDVLAACATALETIGLAEDAPALVTASLGCRCRPVRIGIANCAANLLGAGDRLYQSFVAVERNRDEELGRRLDALERHARARGSGGSARLVAMARRAVRQAGSDNLAGAMEALGGLAALATGTDPDIAATDPRAAVLRILVDRALEARQGELLLAAWIVEDLINGSADGTAS